MHTSIVGSGRWKHKGKSVQLSVDGSQWSVVSPCPTRVCPWRRPAGRRIRPGMEVSRNKQLYAASNMYTTPGMRSQVEWQTVNGSSAEVSPMRHVRACAQRQAVASLQGASECAKQSQWQGVLGGKSQVSSGTSQTSSSPASNVTLQTSHPPTVRNKANLGGQGPWDCGLRNGRQGRGSG